MFNNAVEMRSNILENNPPIYEKFHSNMKCLLWFIIYLEILRVIFTQYYIICLLFTYLTFFSLSRLHRHPMRNRHRRVRNEAMLERWHLQRSHQLFQMHLCPRFRWFSLSDQHRRLRFTAMQERRHLSGRYSEVHMPVPTWLHRRFLRDQHQWLCIESVSQRHLHRWREQLHLQLLSRLHRQAMPDTNRWVRK